MSRLVKRTVLHALRAVGGFALARRMTARGLRILCYHGISLADEHEFQGKLFMRESLFVKRLELIKRQGHPVISLDQAMEQLRAGSLAPGSVVITIDDGWTGTATLAAPLLKQHQFPATLYVATRDWQNGGPVFDVCAQYLLWRGRTQTAPLDLATLDGALGGQYVLNQDDQRRAAADALLTWARQQSAAAKANLLRGLATQLGIDWQAIEQSRMLHLMTSEQARAMAASGIDLQLHTHNHHLPQTDRAQVEQEITLNRAGLAAVTTRPLKHFCYPSGEYHARQFEWLRELDVASATTCKSGFSYPHTNRMEMPRFLDGEDIPEIEFEAELAGVLEVFRRVRRWTAARAHR